MQLKTKIHKYHQLKKLEQWPTIMGYNDKKPTNEINKKKPDGLKHQHQ